MDPNTLKSRKEVGRKEILFSLARVPNSGRVFAGASTGKILDLDLAADKPEAKELAGHESYVTGLALAGGTLVSGGYDGKLIWRNIESGEQIRSADAHARPIRKLSITADGKTLASVGDDMVCRVWELDSGKLKHELKGHAVKTPNHFPSMLYACTFSPDGQHLATVDRTAKAIVWEVASGGKVAEMEAPILYTWDPKQRIHSIGGARSLAFSPDGQRLAIGGMGKVGNIDHLEGTSHVEVFDWRKSERTHELVGDGCKGLVEQLLFSSDGKFLVAIGGDSSGWLQFFDLETKKPVRQEKTGQHWHAAQWGDTDAALFAAGHGKLMQWELS